jgi:ATP-binding cassette, subfamily B, bacterial PglK
LFKRLKTLLINKNKKGLAIILFFILSTMVLETLSIGILYPLIQFIVEGKTNVLILNKFNFLTQNISKELFLWYGLLVILIFYLLKLLFVLKSIDFQNKFIFKVSANISNLLYEKIIRDDFENSISTEVSNIVKKFQNDINHLNVFLLGVLTLAAESIVIIAIVTFLIYIEPFGTTSLLILITLFGVFFQKITSSRLKNLAKKRITFEKGISKLIIESLNGLTEIEVGNFHDFFLKKMKNFNKVKLLVNSNITFLNQSPRFIFEFLMILVIVVFIIVLEKRYTNTTEILTILGIYIAATIRLLPSLNKVIQSTQNLIFYKNSINVIYEELYNGQTVPKDYKNQINFEKKIEFKNIKFSYGSNKVVFDNFNFEIKKGNVIGIYGKSGSGKSTFLNLFTGLVYPSSGEIYIDFNKIENLRNNSWHQQIGYVTQNTFLINDTIKKNIAFGLDDSNIDLSMLEKAIKDADLSDLIKERGLEYIIKENGIGLSGGQKQRVSIARALYKNPKILIFDEATSSLDNASENFIIQTIKKLKKDKTIIIVSHKLSNLEICDQVYEMNKNRKPSK